MACAVASAEGLKTFPSSPPDAATHAKLSAMWNFGELFWPPATWPLKEGQLTELKTTEGTISPLFFEGQLFQGKPTRVFAWVGMPAAASQTHPVPGIVLVHGGGGTAFRDWVRLWVRRGYAAIAMDTGGNVPESPEGMTPKLIRHEWAGPGAEGSFAKAQEPVENQWPYHAVAAVIRAHSLLRSLPGVDVERTGITGISWGGVWTEVVMGLDERFKFAAPVYGCGFLGEDSSWKDADMQRLPEETVSRWLALWDPSQYLSFSRTPVLFVNGTNDPHFRTDSWLKTSRLPGGPATLALKVRMPHGHPPAGDPKEVAVFADSVVSGGERLSCINGYGRDGNKAWVSWQTSTPVVKAELVYTMDSGSWPNRKWETLLAEKTSERAEAEIPAAATAYYFNLHDARGCLVSSPKIP